MEDRTVKVRHILTALVISLIICIGVTFIFWLAEKKNVTDSNHVMNQTERIDDSVYYG